MKFIFKNGRAIPIREKNAGQYAKQAGRLFQKSGSYSSKAAKLEMSGTLKGGMKGLKAYGPKIKHFKARASLALKAGQVASQKSNSAAKAFFRLMRKLPK